MFPQSYFKPRPSHQTFSNTKDRNDLSPKEMRVIFWTHYHFLNANPSKAIGKLGSCSKSKHLRLNFPTCIKNIKVPTGKLGPSWHLLPKVYISGWYCFLISENKFCLCQQSLGVFTKWENLGIFLGVFKKCRKPWNFLRRRLFWLELMLELGPGWLARQLGRNKRK